MTPPSHPVCLSDTVAAALASGAPVVALESTIITHGMPHPQNLDAAMSVESAIIERGAVPATIAVVDGIIQVGLTQTLLADLAQTDDVMKLSRADLAYAVSQKRTGSTTVAATMMVAQMVGLKVFATGGIGGVHAGAEISFDISADLREFSQTDVIVVCAGAKAILDLNKTIEVLETNGIPVIGYQCDQLPAFWSRDSDIAVPLRMDTPKEIAEHARIRSKLGIAGGTLITNPVPADHEIPALEINAIIQTALQDADRLGVSGKDVTPYLLSRMLELTDGKSLQTNIQLILNNARLAADIAVALAQT
ncbi:MAG: pseudouridine-5'-phosphate glycosidase [Rhizobiaceae bacterium]